MVLTIHVFADWHRLGCLEVSAILANERSGLKMWSGVAVRVEWTSVMSERAAVVLAFEEDVPFVDSSANGPLSAMATLLSAMSTSDGQTL